MDGRRNVTGEGRYACFMLRVWRAGASTQSSWRLSLEEIGRSDRQGFPSLEALYTHLQRVLQHADATHDGDPEEDST